MQLHLQRDFYDYFLLLDCKKQEGAFPRGWPQGQTGEQTLGHVERILPHSVWHRRQQKDRSAFIPFSVNRSMLILKINKKGLLSAYRSRDTSRSSMHWSCNANWSQTWQEVGVWHVIDADQTDGVLLGEEEFKEEFRTLRPRLTGRMGSGINTTRSAL